MGDDHRAALARRLAEDEGFRAAIGGARTIDEAVAIAREHGIDAAPEDFAREPGADLTDKEMESLAGGKYPSMDCEYTTPFDMRHQCGTG